MPHLQAVKDFLPGQIVNQTDRSSAQSRMNGMLSNHWNMYMQDLAAVMQAEANTFQPEPFHFIGPQVCFRVEAVEENYERSGGAFSVDPTTSL